MDFNATERYGSAREAVGATTNVVAACVLIVVLTRGWTLIAQPDNPLYAVYPVWVQLVVLFVYLAQIAAEYVTWLDRRCCALAAMLASIVSAVMLARGAFATGGWPLWVGMTVIQAWVYYRLKAEQLSTRR